MSCSPFLHRPSGQGLLQSRCSQKSSHDLRMAFLDSRSLRSPRPKKKPSLEATLGGAFKTMGEEVFPTPTLDSPMSLSVSNRNPALVHTQSDFVQPQAQGPAAQQS